MTQNTESDDGEDVLDELLDSESTEVENKPSDKGCDHRRHAQIEHFGSTGSEFEIWIACTKCSGYWSVHVDHNNITATVSLTNEPELIDD